MRADRATTADLDVMARPWLHTAQSAIVTFVPLLALGLVGWQLWGSALRWHDVVVFAVTYVPVGLGVTVGFHRLFTHRSFRTTRVVRFALGALGSAAVEGPVISWVAAHRRHHALSDRLGDPHSPHVDHDGHTPGVLRGLFHAHVGWLFLHGQRGAKARYAPDLLKDPVTRFVDRTTIVWMVAGLAFPFAFGFALSGSLVGGLTGLLWGGPVRILVLHHVTYSINSLCHVFGRRRYRTADESRNLAWLAPFSLGEAWHNNHHAFPAAASHGHGPGEFDASAAVIHGLERLGLAWDVVGVAPARRAAKALRAE